MNLKGWISWQIALVCIGCLTFGAGLAFVGAVYLLQSDTAVLVGDLKRKTHRVQLLESLVIQQSRSVVARALDQGPGTPPADGGSGAPAGGGLAQTVVAQTTPAEVTEATAAKAHAPASSAAPARGGEEAAPAAAKAKGRSAPEAGKAAATPVARNPKSGEKPAPPAPVSVAVAEPANPARSMPVNEQPAKAAGEVASADAAIVAPTPGEVAAAVKNLKIEGVSADKAGVERLTVSGVYLRGGKVVRVGGVFPSGERLLAVEPENGRVITNQRQILMFF